MQTDEIEKLLAEATPGPWDVDPHGIDDCMGDVWLGEDVRVCENATATDARLIAMAPDLAAEVVRLREALGHLVPATDELLAACEKSGAFDNLVSQLFPERKRRGVRRDDGYAEIDKARSNVRAWLSVARAALEGRE